MKNSTCETCLYMHYNYMNSNSGQDYDVYKKIKKCSKGFF